MSERTKRIYFRVSDEEYIYIKNKANEFESSMSEFIRKSINNKKLYKIYGLEQLVYELRKIGNNLNQITYKVNVGEIKEINLIDTKIEIEKIYNQIENILKKVR